MKKIILEPKQQTSENGIVTIVRFVAILTYILGLIGGIVSGSGEYEFLWSIALPIWILSFVSGTMTLAFAEMISLLDRIANQTYEATIPDLVEDKKSEPSENKAEFTRREKKGVVLDSRPKEEMICPLCGEVQSSSRNTCWNCGCEFVFENEKQKM